MNIIYCNRCRKDISNKPKHKLDIRWEGLKGNGVCYPIPHDDDKQSKMDICVDCYNDFKKFMSVTKKIYAICTTLDAGYDGDKKRILDSGINIGDKIELENACVGRWSTKVYLVGHKGSFNSVFFNFVDENGEEYDIYNDKDFQSYR